MTTGSRTEGLKGIGSEGFIRTVKNLTVTGDLVVHGETRSTVGTGHDVSAYWETADANANYWAYDLPSGGATAVPVMGVGIGLKDVDLGLFDGITQPTLAVLDADQDSYLVLDFSADDSPRIRSNQDITVSGNVVFSDNITVNGTTTTVSSSTVVIDDPLFHLANDNPANSVDLGIIAEYTDSGKKFSGLFRDASDSDTWKLFATTGNSHEEPSTTVNTTSGFTLANLAVNELAGTLTTASQTNITAVGTIATGTWEGTTIAVNQGGTGTTSLNNLITMGTHTTGDYVATITGGTGIDSDAATSGESTAHTLSIDLAEVGEVAIADGDYIAFMDTSDSNATKKEALADVATLFAGTGLTAASSVIDVDAAQAGITSLGTLTGLTLGGNKSVTPGDGAMVHLDSGTITDSNTSASGTAALFTHVRLEAPTLAATNASVTTTDAATLYISAAASAGSNQTITNNYALIVDAGNSRFDGDILVDGDLDFTGAQEITTTSGDLTLNPAGALMATVVADTYVGYRITDGSATYYEMDTRTTAGQAYAHRFDAANPTIASASNSTYALMEFSPYTLTLTGTTQVTSRQNQINIEPITITDSSAVTVDVASTLRIAGAPSAGGSVTITSPLALLVDGGASRFDGAISMTGDLTVDGDLDFTGPQEITTSSGTLTLKATTDTDIVRTTDGVVLTLTKSGVAGWEWYIGNTALGTGVAGTGSLELRPQVGNVEFAILQAGTTNARFAVNPSTGVVQIGGTADHGTAVGTNVFSIFDGTAPEGTLANGCSFYSTSGEMRVMDAGGTATLLSPHDSAGRWVFDSTDTVTGKRLVIHMEKFMKALEAHFGWGFVEEFIEEI